MPVDFANFHQKSVYVKISQIKDLTVYHQSIFDFASNEKNDFVFEHTLGEVKTLDNRYELYIGNEKVVELYPQTFPIEEYKKSIKIEVDGKEIDSKFAQQIDIKESFRILKSDFRVNIIGFSKDGADSEDDILIKKADILDNYSVDTNKTKYRAEFYKDGKFYGMLILNFLAQ